MPVNWLGSAGDSPLGSSMCLQMGTIVIGSISKLNVMMGHSQDWQLILEAGLELNGDCQPEYLSMASPGGSGFLGIVAAFWEEKLQNKHFKTLRGRLQGFLWCILGSHVMSLLLYSTSGYTGPVKNQGTQVQRRVTRGKPGLLGGHLWLVVTPTYLLVKLPARRSISTFIRSRTVG